MSASIKNVISLSLQATAEGARSDNVNDVMIVTSRNDTLLSTDNRYEDFLELSSIGDFFGTNSQEYAHGSAFLSTSPNAVDAGGTLRFGYWRETEEVLSGTQSILTGGEVEFDIADQLQNISDGSFNISLTTPEDGYKTFNIRNLDFNTVVTETDVEKILDDALFSAFGGSAVAVFGGGGITFKFYSGYENTGSGVSITTTSDVLEGELGTGISSILLTSTTMGAIALDGTDADSTIAPEEKLEALDELKAKTSFKGVFVINTNYNDYPEDIATEEALGLAEWAVANDTLVYEVFSNTQDLETNIARAPWAIKLAGLNNFRSLFSLTNDRKMASSYMARMHTTNFDGENTATSMHLKELSVTPDDLSQTQINKAKDVGLDVYVTIKDVPVLLTSGANDFTDNVYNLIAFGEELNTDVFNVLKTTNTKIGQTIRGVNAILDQLEKTTLRFVKANVFGPGTWNSTDRFGDVDIFNKNIEENGFYWKAGSLADQSATSRTDRESPVIQGAVKNVGAIHSVDIIVNFNQ